MKKSILVFLLAYYTSYSQWGSIKLIHARPTEDFGYVYKPAFSAELGFVGEKNKLNLVPRIGFGFIRFSPRLDTFPAVVIAMYNGNVYGFAGGKFAPANANLFYADFGLDYKIKILESWSCYPGIDLKLGDLKMSHYESYPGTFMRSGVYEQNGYIFGLGLRVGSDYGLNDRISLFAEVKRNFNRMFYRIDEDEKFIKDIAHYNEYALGIRFKLKN